MSSLPNGGMATTSFSYPIYQILRDQNRANPHPVLGDLVAFKDLGSNRGLTASINGHSEVATAELVSGNFFQQLGVNSALGRTIHPRTTPIPVPAQSP